MGAFEQYAREFIEAAIRRFPAEEIPDIYVVSVFVYDEDDDPALPTARVGYNTESIFHKMIPMGASDEAEARWNCAFWPHNDFGKLCDPDRDPQGAALRDEWIAEQGLVADDMAPPGSITHGFVGVMAGVVRGLHADGVIEEVLGRPLPVLIHQLEYYDEIAEQNRRANPDGLAEPLADWIADQ